MRIRGKTRYIMGWIGLIAYLFLGLLSSQTAMALTSALAGPHGVSIVSDGSHQDIVFTHDHINAHRHGHSHSHGHTHSHQHGSDNFDSVFGNHEKPHSDHVVHLSKPPEQISAQVPVLQLDSSQYLHHIAMPTAVMAPVACFLKTVSIQALAQPPPRSLSQLASLRTIILLI